ncbi:MAG: hypothetical protein ABI723_18425 [Bacteroidia bacterium]
MKKIIKILVVGILISACGQKAANTNSTPIVEADTISIPKENKGSLLAVLATLDSIDRANNQSVIASGDDITKAYIMKSDSSIFLTANMRLDHRVFGYAQPDIKSKRLLLLSVFTNDVEKNPFGCELGAYYDTGGMENMKLKFQEQSGDFIKAVVIDKSNKKTTVYFEKKWIEFM